MSSRKNRQRINQPRPSRPQQVQTVLVSKEDLLKPEAMNNAQANHLQFLEEYGRKMPKLYGVSVVSILNYETLQIVNDVYLRAVLA